MYFIHCDLQGSGSKYRAVIFVSKPKDSDESAVGCPKHFSIGKAILCHKSFVLLMVLDDSVHQWAINGKKVL